MQRRSAYRVEEHFQEYRHLVEVELAEERFPLQQFYLVPMRLRGIHWCKEVMELYLPMSLGTQLL